MRVASAAVAACIFSSTSFAHRVALFGQLGEARDCKGCNSSCVGRILGSSCPQDSEHVHKLACYKDDGKRAGIGESGRCLIKRHKICNAAAPFCRPKTVCQAYEYRKASLQLCADPGETSEFISKDWGTQLDESLTQPLSLSTRSGKPIVLERTARLTEEALFDYGSSTFGLESCRACFAYVWRHITGFEKYAGNIQGKSGARANWSRAHGMAWRKATDHCEFGEPSLNAACVWVQTLGFTPQDLTRTMYVADPYFILTDRFVKRASAICQAEEVIDGTALPQICPNFMNTSTILWKLGVHRCRCEGSGNTSFVYSDIGDQLCTAYPVLNELVVSILGPSSPLVIGC